MGYEAVPAGNNPPDEVNVIIEIPAGHNAVKYEVDKDSNTLVVDRFMNVSMHYPANYGFVPQTLHDDGDPIDALVLAPEPVVAGCVMKARPVAVLNTEDENGMDAKIVCVPTDKVSTGYYQDVQDVGDLSDRLKNRIKHFFEHYKDLEQDKWVKVTDWQGADTAKQAIRHSITAYGKA